MHRYFAYGSALSKRHIGEWAAEHGVDARLFARGVAAVLRGYRLAFDVESRFWGGRVANLAEDKDGEVHGVLFEIPPPAKEAVLRKEGVSTGLSEEIDVFVEAEGKRIAAKAYVARPAHTAGSAPGRYLRTHPLRRDRRIAGRRGSRPARRSSDAAASGVSVQRAARTGRSRWRWARARPDRREA